jgi:DNA replication and repair protein RecF
MSLVGPQRDDVGVTLSGPEGPLDARTYASQGDQRTAALALKLAEHDLLSEALDEHPILLLDDVFSELDPARRGWLAEAVGSMGQTILSSADAAGAPGVRVDRTIEIAAGKVVAGGPARRDDGLGGPARRDDGLGGPARRDDGLGGPARRDDGSA